MEFDHNDDPPKTADWAEAWWPKADEISNKYIMRWKKRKLYSVVDGWSRADAKVIADNIKTLDAAKAIYAVTCQEN